jgi:hypothetical protein
MNRFYQHPWGRVLLEKLKVPQLVKKFLTFSGSRFISTFTRACHLPICGDAHYYSLYLPPLLRHLSQQKNSVSGLSKEVLPSAQSQLLTLAANYSLRGPSSSSELRKSVLLHVAG